MPEGQKAQILYLVIPCCNEADVLLQTASELKAVMSEMKKRGLIAEKSRIVFVDDGSRDGSWALMRRLAEEDSSFGALALLANAGHQNALYAGLMAVKGSCHMSISLDADLQDDPALIPAMVEQFYQGSDVVYAVRRSRRGEGLLKKASASLFYRMMRGMGAALPAECGDFRLLSRRAMDYLALYREDRPFLRGLIPLLGLPSAYLTFDRRPRRAGKSKYTLGKMLRFAMDGLCSLSTKPIACILGLGLLLMGGSGLWLLARLGEPAGPGTMIAVIWAACGLVLASLGLLGQYIGRIWQAQLGRPRWVIQEAVGIGEGDITNLH